MEASGLKPLSRGSHLESLKKGSTCFNGGGAATTGSSRVHQIIFQGPGWYKKKSDPTPWLGWGRGPRVAVMAP